MLTASIIPKPYAGCNRVFRPSPAPAQAAEVVSSNIVGYHKLNVDPDNNQIVGVQFTTVGANTLDIQDLVLEGVADGDRIQFFNGVTYDAYLYAEETYDETGEEDLGPGWTDEVTGLRAERALIPGQAFWLRASGESATMTFGGEVKPDGSYSANCGGVFALVAVPTPVKKDLQSVTFENIADGDRIQFFNGTTYDAFTYAEETYDETGEEDLGPGWTDEASGLRAEKEVQLNDGFWLMSESDTVSISVE